MKVRSKFTVAIATFALCTTVFFFAFVYFEIGEEFYEHADYELSKAAESILEALPGQDVADSLAVEEKLAVMAKLYWLKLYRGDGTLLFASELARNTDIPFYPEKTSYSVSNSVPLAQIWIPAEEQEDIARRQFDEVPWRVRVQQKERAGQRYIVQLAMPILLFKLELLEFVETLAVIIIGTIVLAAASSWLLAGRLLRPLGSINAMIRKIREHSLDSRIPLGKSRDELYELSQSLNAMFDRLQHSFQQQKEFVGNASHEMKSPLTILMLGHEDLLAEELPEKVRAEMEKQLTTLRRLNRLVRDLLDIARLEHQEVLSREVFSMSALIKRITDEYTGLLDTAHASIDTRIPEITVCADQEKLARLIINLLDNALKYCDEQNGQITVAAGGDDAGYWLRVANNGQGIPAADLPHIFTQFYRVEKSRAKVFGGTGLGLTIAKRIVELHGGTLSVISDSRLTVFTAVFPEGLLKSSR